MLYHVPYWYNTIWMNINIQLAIAWKDQRVRSAIMAILSARVNNMEESAELHGLCVNWIVVSVVIIEVMSRSND